MPSSRYNPQQLQFIGDIAFYMPRVEQESNVQPFLCMVWKIFEQVWPLNNPTLTDHEQNFKTYERRELIRQDIMWAHLSRHIFSEYTLCHWRRLEELSERFEVWERYHVELHKMHKDHQEERLLGLQPSMSPETLAKACELYAASCDDRIATDEYIKQYLATHPKYQPGAARNPHSVDN